MSEHSDKQWIYLISKSDCLKYKKADSSENGSFTLGENEMQTVLVGDF